MLLAHGNRGGDVVHGSVLVQRVPDRHDRRAMAPAHAGGADDPDPIAEPAAQIFEQPRRAGQLAAQAVANPHGQRRRRRLVVHDDVEMSIERGDLVDLDEGEPHLLGERREMPRMQAPEMVLQQVQVFDQQVAPALAFAEQSPAPRRARRDRPAVPSDDPARAAAPTRDGCAGRVLGTLPFEARSKPLSALQGGEGGARAKRGRVRWASAVARDRPHLTPTLSPPRGGEGEFGASHGAVYTAPSLCIAAMSSWP